MTRQTTILFTQYLRPYGTPKPVSITLDDPDGGLALIRGELGPKGLTPEVEVLSDGTVSLTISNGEEDIAMELVANGPGVPAAVARLLRKLKLPPDGET